MSLLRLLIGAVFVFSGGTKLRYPRVFAEALVAYQLLPAWLVTLVAVVLPPLELLAGLALISGYKRKGTCLVLGALSGGFLVFVASALFRGLDTSCGCFMGGEASRVGVLHLLVNALLPASLGLIYREKIGR